MATTQDYLQKSSDGTAVSHLNDSIVYHDTTNSRIGISTSSPADKLDVKGNLRITHTADAYPVLSILNYDYNNVSLNFDSYFDGSWRSSQYGSNFRIYKIGHKLRFSYAREINQGSVISDWASEDSNCAMVINQYGHIGMGTTDPASDSTLRVVGKLKVENGTDAPLALSILTSDPASPAGGEIWLLSSGGDYYLKIQTGSGPKSIKFT